MSEIRYPQPGGSKELPPEEKEKSEKEK